MSIATSFLKLENISKIYDDGYQACQNINFSVQKGKFLTILGPSGCGKSTIIKMISGFEMPTTGKIIVNNIDIKDLPIHKRPTATVFQDYALFPNMTVYQNIIYGIKKLREKKENIPPEYSIKLNKVRSEALKLAYEKINKLKQKQLYITKEILKYDKFYQDNLYLLKIKDMRKSQFQETYLSLLEKYKRHQKNIDFILSFKNKILLFTTKILAKLHFAFLPNLKIKTDCKYEIEIIKLLKYYYFKSDNDRSIDKLKNLYREYDEWISYWENYVDQMTESFEKKYTTRQLSKAEIDAKANEAIKLVNLTGYENKYPSDLSGGMQQRVALARAIVVKPDILLLDEPLSALDAKVRQKMQNELKRIHDELKINFILVTHDQEEALSLSDMIIVMSKGIIQQIGTPKSIYERPANEWVAQFIGQANFLNAKYVNNEILLENTKIATDNIKYNFSKLTNNNLIKLMIRPEDIYLTDEPHCIFKAKILSCIYKGLYYSVVCKTVNNIVLNFNSSSSIQVNTIVYLNWKSENIILIPIKSQISLE